MRKSDPLKTKLEEVLTKVENWTLASTNNSNGLEPFDILNHQEALAQLEKIIDEARLEEATYILSAISPILSDIEYRFVENRIKKLKERQ